MGYGATNSLYEGSILDSLALNEMATVIGKVIDILTWDDASGYCKLDLSDQNNNRFIASGVVVSNIHLNRYYKFTGVVASSTTIRYLSIIHVSTHFPDSSDLAGDVLYHIPVADTIAWSIANALSGENVLEVICNDPQRVAALGIDGCTLERVRSIREELLDSVKVEEIVKALLDSGLSIRDAKRMIDKHGVDILDVMRNDPYYLANQLGEVSFRQCDMIALKKSGMTYSDPRRITAAAIQSLRQYAVRGDTCIPYITLRSKICENLRQPFSYAKAVEVAADETYKGAANFAFRPRSEVNNYYIPMKDIIAFARGDIKDLFYAVPHIEDIERTIDSLGNSEYVSMNIYDYSEDADGDSLSGYFYLKKYDVGEGRIASAIASHLMNDVPFDFDNEPFIQKCLKENGVTLEEHQLAAVREFTKTKYGIFLLQGVAGGGKTFTIDIIVQVLKMMYEADGRMSPDIQILAPTGKAAKVATAATGLPAMTIHRAIGVTNDGGVRVNYINSDVVVIDEVSMLDTILGGELLSRISDFTKIILVGDPNQLPSIGAGNVIRDIAKIDSVKSVSLDVVKRQAEGSAVLVNATRARTGEMIESVSFGENNKSVLVPARGTSATAKKLIEVFESELAHYPVMDVQVLCPKRVGPVGANTLNYMLQNAYLKSIKSGEIVARTGATVEWDDGTKRITEYVVFRKGDKVIHTVNNYNTIWYYKDSSGMLCQNYEQLGIVNGEIGIVEDVFENYSVDYGKTVVSILVHYDRGYVRYDGVAMSQISHAYAMTIHKSQGSQWPVTITPLAPQDSRMLKRNLIYTMLTRAVDKNYIIGDSKVLNAGVQSIDSQTRRSGLLEHYDEYVRTLSPEMQKKVQRKILP